MTIRWRLSLLAVQLVVLVGVTKVVTGSLLVGHAWFLAGLLAIVINPHLLEPWYTRPQDTLVNGTIALALVLTANKSQAAYPGWVTLGIVVGVLAMAALFGLALGAGRERGMGSGLGRSASVVSRIGSAAAIYSGVFWLAAFEYSNGINSTFWQLGGGWLVLILLGSVNWQAVVAAGTRRSIPCKPDGMIGPSVLLVSGPSLPAAGANVTLSDGRDEFSGTILTRIQRASDAWAEVFVEGAASCQTLVQSHAISITESDAKPSEFVGSVDSGSSHAAVEFVAVQPLRIGGVVSVPFREEEILYQISSARLDRSSVRGGSHLITRARGVQLGHFDETSLRIRRHPWVPTPGAPVRSTGGILDRIPAAEASWLELGFVIGTKIPVYLDMPALCEGHLVVLGMTRMGKTTLSVKVAQALSERFRVTILDQTGEYVGKRGFAKWAKDDEDSPGLSVWEPETGKTPPDRTLAYLEWLVDKAMAEYAAGEPPKRIVMLEEAHQFIPEPAGLGFSAPGRDSAYRFGTLMMQVRKYGITIALISQRTAVVAKSALSQCENVIAFKSVDKTGLDYLEALAGSDARDLLPTLAQGQALVFGPAFSSDGPVAIQVHREAKALAVAMSADQVQLRDERHNDALAPADGFT